MIQCQMIQHIGIKTGGQVTELEGPEGEPHTPKMCSQESPTQHLELPNEDISTAERGPIGINQAARTPSRLRGILDRDSCGV